MFQRIIFTILTFGYIITAYGQQKNVIVLPDTTYEVTDPDFELLVAVSEGDTLKASALLEIGANVNYTLPDGVTPLMYASQGGHLRLVEILIDSGANVNKIPYSGVSALLGACIGGHVMVADTLIQNGANINTTNNNGNTCLMYACAYNDYILADMLLYYGINVNQSDNDGNVAIHYSTYYGNIEITELLLENGANLNTIDIYGFTPLMISSQNGHMADLDYLTKLGAKDTVNKENMNALTLAIVNKQYESVNYLLENVALANHIVSRSANPLSLAHEYTNKRYVNLLKSYHAENNRVPRIDRMNINMDLLGTNNDFMFGFSIGVFESKYNLRTTIGYKVRPWVRSVLYELNSTTHYQLWENRSCIHLGLEKHFNFFRSLDEQNGILIGLKGIYTYGKFRGSKKIPDNRVYLVPTIGYQWNIRKFNANLCYEYFDLKNSKSSSHWISVSLGFNINLSKERISIKKEPKL